MKALRLGFLTALLTGPAFAAAPVIPPQLANLAGNYQALLYTQADDAGSPTALVTLTLTNKGALTGKLTTEENKTYAFKTTLNYEAAESPEEAAPIGTATQATAISIVRGKDLPNWNLNLSITDFEEAEADTLSVNLMLGDEPAAGTANGFKQITFAKGALAYAAAGAYTAAFELADEPGQNDPTGSGYATATIDAKGLLKLAGKTGDGTAITASLPAGPDYRYVAFLNPYKRINSLFAGKITLTERASGGFHAVPASGDGYDFQWKKSSLLPKTTDKSYRAGFGPLDVLLTMEPWTAPAKGQTIADLFGLDLETEVFEIDLGIVVPSDRKPTMLVINSKNALEVKYSGAGLVTDQKAFAKIFTGKVDPKTGKITASLNLEDYVMTSPGKFKVVKRKVVIEGVLLHFADGFDAFASAFSLLPPLDVKTGTTTSGGLVFEDIQTDPMIIEAEESGLSGNYRATFDQQLISIGFPPDGIPGQGAIVDFSISADLRAFSFNGINLPLKSYDPVGGVIVFSDETFNTKKYNIATLRLNLVTRELYKCDVFYFEFMGSRSVPVTKSGTAMSKLNTISKILPP